MKTQYVTDTELWILLDIVHHSRYLRHRNWKPDGEFNFFCSLFCSLFCLKFSQKNLYFTKNSPYKNSLFSKEFARGAWNHIIQKLLHLKYKDTSYHTRSNFLSFFIIPSTLSASLVFKCALSSSLVFKCVSLTLLPLSPWNLALRL